MNETDKQVNKEDLRKELDEMREEVEGMQIERNRLLEIKKKINIPVYISYGIGALVLLIALIVGVILKMEMIEEIPLVVIIIELVLIGILMVIISVFWSWRLIITSKIDIIGFDISHRDFYGGIYLLALAEEEKDDKKIVID